MVDSHRRRLYLRLLDGALSAEPEDLQALALGGLGLLVVQGDELESGWIAASNHQRGANLQSARGAQRMRLDEALGVAPRDVDRLRQARRDALAAWERWSEVT